MVKRVSNPHASGALLPIGALMFAGRSMAQRRMPTSALPTHPRRHANKHVQTGHCFASAMNIEKAYLVCGNKIV